MNTSLKSRAKKLETKLNKKTTDNFDPSKLTDRELEILLDYYAKETLREIEEIPGDMYKEKKAEALDILSQCECCYSEEELNTIFKKYNIQNE